jgi:hypothetical protein
MGIPTLILLTAGLFVLWLWPDLILGSIGVGVVWLASFGKIRLSPSQRREDSYLSIGSGFLFCVACGGIVSYILESP